MTCKACIELEIGVVYDLTSGKCVRCESPALDVQGVYIGKSEDGRYHIFAALDSQRCPSCGHGGTEIAYPCSELNVTEEFQLLSNTKDSHWVGGRHA